MRSQARSLPLLRLNAEATRLDQEVDPGHAAAFLRGVECAHAAGHGSEHSKGVHVSASTAGTSERWGKTYFLGLDLLVSYNLLRTQKDPETLCSYFNCRLFLTA